MEEFSLEKMDGFPFPFYIFLVSCFQGQGKKKTGKDTKEAGRERMESILVTLFSLVKEEEYLSSNAEMLQTFPLRVTCHF